MSFERSLQTIRSPPCTYPTIEGYGDIEMVDCGQDTPFEEDTMRGCLVLCCCECNAVALIQFSRGYVPASTDLPTTSRSNALCLTCCKKCCLRTNSRPRRERGNRNGSDARSQNICFLSSLWNDLDASHTATLVLGEDVAFATDGEFARYFSWSEISSQTDRSDRMVSLDVDRFISGERTQIVLPHVNANWL